MTFDLLKWVAVLCFAAGVLSALSLRMEEVVK